MQGGEAAAESPSQLPAMQRGGLIELRLHSWGRLGEAMATHQGRDVFVFGGIPGEVVEVEVVAIRRKYVAAQVTRVVSAAPERVEPRCPYFGECTGCQWQHLSYDRQLAVKRQLVADALERVGGFYRPPVRPTLPSPRQYHYRNHARFNVWRESGALGFTHRERRRFVRIDRCLLMDESINGLLARLQGCCGETSQLAIRSSPTTGDYLIQPALRNPDVPVPTGQQRYREAVGGREFMVASPSFFQVNVEQAAKLAELVKEALGLTGAETVLDAYAGVGTFAALLAPDAGRVIGVEESTAAVADARENAAGLGNVEFVAGKVEEVLPGLAETPDVVVLDPSRRGCQGEALEALLRLRPARIAYVSCHPESLARDLAVLCRGYGLESVQPVDMFPQTHHIECVATLEAKMGAGEVTLASESPRRRELLTDLGIAFRVAPSQIPEDPEPGEAPEGMVRRLSREKALAVARREKADAGYYIAADSTVVLDGAAMAKPGDADEARDMLTRLRGRAHQVITGFTVYDAATGRCLTEAMSAEVLMRDFTDAEMEQSIASGTPMDKAGAYAIQDGDFRPATLQRGCYSNVMGLPVCRVTELLAELGCPLPDLAGARAPAGGTEGCPFAGGGSPGGFLCGGSR